MKNTLLLTAVMASTLIALPALAAEESCVEISKGEVSALFNRWNASLQTGDAEKVAENYAPDAVLLPTVSNKPRTDHEGIKDYFEHFLQKKPIGRIDTSTIQIGCNQAFDAGTYTFTVKGPDGKLSNVPARYTFIYTYKDGQWLIAHHHSSAMPEKPEAEKTDHKTNESKKH